MQPAVYETTSLKIDGGQYRFTASASKITFDGYMLVYTTGEEDEENKALIGSITEDKKLSLEEFSHDQHFTQPPAHYTEASLVKTLEELGIGRPSTYAPTITTILARRYVVKENKNLYVTELGEVVNNIMKQSFPSIVDVNFTVNLESLLDGVEAGSISWKTVVSNFYPDLDEAVKAAEKELAQVKIADEVSDVDCEECGSKMVIKYGPHGKFLACPNFPDCRNTKPKDHADYWRAKSERNRLRDAAATERLTALGYLVIRIWECDFKKVNQEKLDAKLFPIAEKLREMQ